MAPVSALVSSASALSLDAAEDGIEGEEDGVAGADGLVEDRRAPGRASPSVQPLRTAP